MPLSRRPFATSKAALEVNFSFANVWPEPATWSPLKVCFASISTSQSATSLTRFLLVEGGLGGELLLRERVAGTRDLVALEGLLRLHLDEPVGDVLDEVLARRRRPWR